MKNTAVAVAALLLLAVPTFAEDPEANVACATDWGYGATNGPNRWGQLQPAYADCDSGAFQSPVGTPADFRDDTTTLSAHYEPSLVTVQHTAHAINVYNLHPADRMTFGSVTARLAKFHFHYPGEHLTAGRDELELHLVHFSDAKKGYVLAVAIRLDPAAPRNEAVTRLLAAFPPNACTSATVDAVDLRPLLPSTAR